LGVTPSAWTSGEKAIQFAATGNIAFNGTAGRIVTNAYNDGSFKYVGTGQSAIYAQDGGRHIWYNAPSGTAGNAITFTQAMTLTAAGRLGIGQTAPGVALSVAGASEVWQIALAYANSGTGAVIGSPASDVIAFGSWAGAERVRIDSSGRLGIGQTSPQTALGFANTATLSWGTTNYPFISGDQPNNTITFGTQATERARIDSSGNLLIGTTNTTFSSGGVRLYANNSFEVVRDGTAGSTVANVYLNKTGSTDGDIEVFNRSGTKVGSVSVTASATAYNTSSDYRLKNTIAPMTGALAKVAKLKPVTYKWNADGSNGEGFIAHELAEVCPDAVNGEKDAVDANGNPEYQGIDTSFLVATLTAALQEQQAIIESLTQRIATLEAK
jgi:hypothetical protein